MKAYELLYIATPNLEDIESEVVLSRIMTAIADGGGVVDNVDNWGRRKLAYEIDGQTDGNYTLIDFHTDPQSIAELDRILRINDAVMRSMIVARVDKDEE